MNPDDLIPCQLNCIRVIYGCPMDIEQAIIQLSLNSKKCLKIAKKEGMPYYVINAIKNTITGDV